MTTIYIVRHGATKLNNQMDMSEDRIRGWTDVPLAEEGRKEAQAAGLKLKAKGVEAIVASSLSRARETAEIIGKIVGVKPVVSEGLRPWNLGTFTGSSTKEALPKIADYVRNKPDEAVPKGESFNQFKHRAFGGLADAIEANQGKVLVIVTHHRNERLYEAWEKAGRPEDLSIDLATFLSKGDPPGGIKEIKIGDVAQELVKARSSAATTRSPSMAGKNGPNMPNPFEQPAQTAQAAPEGAKLSHAAVGYTLAKPGDQDRCANCKSFQDRNDCIKVVPPIAPAGWCRVGHSKADGHAFDQAAEGAEQDAGAAPAAEAPKAPVNVEALSHGRAIAGAKALHAVGHISAAERDQHVKASQKFISKRKAFGSWAP